MKKLINKIIILVGIMLSVSCIEQKQEPVNSYKENTNQNQPIIINQQDENELTHL